MTKLEVVRTTDVDEITLVMEIWEIINMLLNWEKKGTDEITLTIKKHVQWTK